MKEEKFSFISLNGQDIIDNHKDLYKKMQEVEKSREELRGYGSLLDYLDEEINVTCMLNGEELLGFAWTVLNKEEKIAELSWLVTNKNKIKAMQAKKLLNKVLEECKAEGMKSIMFNCFDESWKRIKDKEKLFEKFGYVMSEEKYGYDMAIDL